ncbi:enoyl-CoA hydratase-related protein [Janthinobacterium sp. PC23-8]|uniref:enoyl-CoA hydratase-related protein n=1 Tax=Janthinobacterium sp. PC23-8 TaxID=2012679 RepID=UPI000B9755D3|nr:enoyl-CoA hydratase-related protein [Janthinobacterium sp. PC23-8]OYO26346.1 hypothetical protein CD932_24195 [Janthinobacterium sp. PC23-8]
MSQCAFTLSHENGVSHLVLNRPEVMNALSLDTLHAIGGEVRAMVATGNTRALVISSTGKHFSSGIDLQQLSGAFDALELDDPRGRFRFQRWLAGFMDDLDIMAKAPFPVIAAIHGGCLGVAFDLVLACDMRYSTSDAFFVVQEINIGTMPDMGTLQRLPKLIPDGIAREYALTGRRLLAARARELGLVNDTFADAHALLDGAMAVAHEIAARSPLAVAGCKAALNFARDHSVDEGLAQQRLVQAAFVSLADIGEAMAAMQGKRPANFADCHPDLQGLRSVHQLRQ